MKSLSSLNFIDSVICKYYIVMYICACNNDCMFYRGPRGRLAVVAKSVMSLNIV